MIQWEQVPSDDYAGFVRKGITWLASWPKSGNTWVRLFLSAYLRGPDNFSLSTLNLQGDAQLYHYQMHSPVPIGDVHTSDLWRIRAAALWTMYVTSRKTNLLLKTHFCNAKVNDYLLIPPDLTHKAVYIVRDPRDVLVSWKRYSEIPWDKAYNDMTSDTMLLHGSAGTVTQFISSWKSHVNSWLSDDDMDKAVIQYEGLLSDPESGMKRVLDFLEIPFDTDRFYAALLLTELNSLKKVENEAGFIDNVSGEKFFHKGGSRWQEELPKEYADRVLQECGDVMARFGYT